MIITLLCMFSYFLSVYLYRYDPMLSYYMIFTRCWELLFGVVAALVLLNNRVVLSCLKADLLIFLSLSVILISFIFVGSNFENGFNMALLPVISTFVIIVFGRNSKCFKKILSSKLLVSIGLLSYGCNPPIFRYNYK